MRFLTAVLWVALAFAFALYSQSLLAGHDPRFVPLIASAWTAIAGCALLGLVWLYLQIAIGPRSTVPTRAVDALERDIEAMQKAGGSPRKSRARRLAARAQKLADRIEPALEARFVYERRVRLTNAVLALIAILSFAFWMVASLGPRLWPMDPFFTANGQPDAYHAALFSVDQITRGTMFDLFEVFHWNLSGLDNNPSNVVFSSLIVLYRLFVGGALVAALAVRLGMREDWHERAAREAAQATKDRLSKLAADA